MEFKSDDTIFLRAFAAVSNEAAAMAVCQSIKKQLSRHGTPTRSDFPKRYWKIPEYYEVFVELRPSKPVPEAFESILTELGLGWEAHRFADGGNWAAWNPGTGGSFCIPEVRWAHLECLYRGETASSEAKD